MFGDGTLLRGALQVIRRVALGQPAFPRVAGVIQAVAGEVEAPPPSRLTEVADRLPNVLTANGKMWVAIASAAFAILNARLTWVDLSGMEEPLLALLSGYLVWRTPNRRTQ